MRRSKRRYYWTKKGADGVRALPCDASELAPAGES
jgi:hypothetical protein